ncbi:MAG: hypothetical protein NVS4B3_06230 [Gemmatimonadaceae bacterium]
MLVEAALVGQQTNALAPHEGDAVVEEHRNARPHLQGGAAATPGVTFCRWNKTPRRAREKQHRTEYPPT